MEPLDHDMDDLLRKAAADYPLNEGESDWDKLSARLSEIPVEPEVAQRKNFRYYFLLIFALVLFLVLGGLFYYDRHRNELMNETKYTRSTSDSIQAQVFEKNSNKNDITVQSNDKIISQKSTDLVESKVPIRRIIQSSGDKFPTIVKSPGSIKNSPGKERPPGETTDYFSFIAENKSGGTDKAITESAYVLKSSRVKALPVILQYAIPEPALRLTPIRIQSNHLQSQKGLYIGFNGGPELSKVGSQTIARTGYHVGVLLGYRFNTKLSVESGIMVGKKKYYSMGEFFSMSKIASTMPLGMEIVNVDGQSSQLEIPLTLKYDFLQRTQSRFFFTAGVVSYVYLQEKNHYQTKLNGVEENQMGMYKEDHFSLTSELQISGGYEHTLGKSVRFRIEPYKKIPLKKSGMGSMSVFSSGVNIALIRSFGK
ncbi:MAG: porin family protein [Chitinophagaceae bacterium]